MTATLERPDVDIVSDPRGEAERFLFALYPGAEPQAGEWWELRCLRAGQRGPRRYFRSRMQLVDAAMVYKRDWDVYIGVGYRKCPASLDITRCPHTVKGADHVSRLPALWIDVDVCSPDEPNKRYASHIDALEALYALATPPSLIVGSGMGFHAYWPLSTPAHDLEAVASRNKKAARALRVDNTWDPARILRLPGTLNHKHGEPLPVTLIESPAR